MARKTDRNFLPDFATLDIEYLPQKGPEVSNDIQMVYVMGNVVPAAVGGAAFVPGWQAPNPILASYGVTVFENAVAAEFLRVELIALAGGGGLWVYAISSIANADRGVRVFTIGASTGLANRILPTAANSTAYGAGAAATAIFDSGTTAVAAPASALRIDISESSVGRPEQFTGDGQTGIYIGPGRVFVIQFVTAALGEFVGVQWREIP